MYTQTSACVSPAATRDTAGGLTKNKHKAYECTETKRNTMGSDLKDASDAEFRSVKPTTAQQDELERERIEAMDFANREGSSLKRSLATRRKSVRFSGCIEHKGNDPLARTPISPRPTYERHDLSASHSTLKSTDRLPHEELLMPVCYSPPSENESESEHSTLSDDSWSSVKHNVERLEAQYALPESDVDQITKPADLTVEISPYQKHTRNTSSISGRGRRDSHQFEIYFTPTDYTRSQIFLSSPVRSPELSKEHPDYDCLTPKASMSRPPSAIFVGSDSESPSNDNVKKEKLSITSAQFDQLITALAGSQLVQKHVRKQWWDNDDIPDDAFSVNSVAVPASSRVSAMSSRQDETFLEEQFGRSSLDHPYAKRPLPIPPVPFGGIALLDSKIHGSPIRFISRDYRQGSKVLSIGSNTFLDLPYGTDVECNLRVEPASPFNDSCKVMLQAINQAVNRKTSKRAYTLAAEVEVTDLFAKAALTELAEATGKSLDDITVQKSTVATSDESVVDWCALADEIDTSLVVEHAVQAFSALNSGTCAMRTLALMSELERIKDEHMDFLIVVPTKFHENGMPSKMRMPWVSQRLYDDWYGAKDGPGFTQTAREFQQNIVAGVAKMAKENFTVSIAWKEDQQIVHCVQLRDGEHGEGAAWVCFIRGEFDLQSR